MISESAKIGKNVKVGLFSIIEDGVEIGDNCFIGPFCIIKKNAKIGFGCKLSSYCEIRENVVIGNNCQFGSRCTISKNGQIGNNVIIKYSFVLTDTPELQENELKSVGRINNGVLIGANVTLMPGISIGQNSIIGACSQIRTNVGENEIWYGNPAKFFKFRDLNK
jgi:UDP-2-acetamido-3-amino-2,3-dideoxy-glucuronate N-acetyltransferase